MLPLLHARSDAGLALRLAEALADLGVQATARVARGRRAAAAVTGHDGAVIVLLTGRSGVGHRAGVEAARADGATVVVVTGPAASMPRDWRGLARERLSLDPAAAGTAEDVIGVARQIAARLGPTTPVDAPGVSARATAGTRSPRPSRARAAGSGSGASPARQSGRASSPPGGRLRLRGERLVDPKERLDLGLLGGLGAREVPAQEEVRIATARTAVDQVDIEVKPETVVQIELEGRIELYTRYDQLREDLGAGIDLELPARLGGAVSRGGRGLLDIGTIRLFEVDLVGLLADAGKDRLLALLRSLHPGLADTAAGFLDGLADRLAEELRGYARATAANLAAFGLARLSEVLFMPRPGLVRWAEPATADNPVIGPGELDAAGAAPWLVFLHGTASSTEGSFGALRAPDPKAPWRAEVWPELERAYGDRILALEHHTLTVSPIENAIELLSVLPAGARLHLVSHSRGGLIGELLARGQRDDGDPFDEIDLRCFDGHPDRDALDRLSKLLDDRAITIERFVRVACPAAGTTLASERLDRWLSILLNAIGLIPTLAGNPIYAFVKSFLLAMVETKAEPRWLPGLEAMIPDAACSRMLNRPDVATAADLSAIAGDIEDEGVLRRLAILATDWFYGSDHDLVVDTFSMAGGTRRPEALYLFDQGADVSHFEYFTNRDTVEGVQAALRGRAADAGFVPLERPPEITDAVYRKRAIDQPVVFVLPGIMGSHLARDGNRIWLDPIDLALGRLFELETDAEGVVATAPVGTYYRDLVEWLARSHEVIPFAYDWRRSMRQEATRFAAALRERLDRTDQPVRIVAHSMGGLIARLALAQDSESWGRFRRRERARLLMLGTPTRGSLAMARALLGEDRMIRALALLDFRHDQDEILGLIAALPGVLELLPADGSLDLFDATTWQQLGARAVPAPERLAEARQTRLLLDDAPLEPGLMVYVAGTAEATPSDLVRSADGEVRFEATARGDGRVPWATGIPPGMPTWYAAAEHGDLARHEHAFHAYEELLATGSTRRLPDLPPARRAGVEAVSFTLPPDRVARFPDADDVAAAALGGRRRLPERARRRLRVEVVHGDLRFARFPVLVGHYDGDTFAGSEATLDRALGGRLEARRAQGLYPGPLGTSEVVLDPVSTPPGALVFGLGQVGKLSVADLRRGIALATRRYLLALQENPDLAPSRGPGLTALLVGSGEGGLALDDALAALLDGIADAQRGLRGPGLSEIEVMELWADRALKTAHALGAVVNRSPALGDVFDPAEALIDRDGGRRRAFASEDPDWWQRLLIEDDKAGGLRFTTLHTERARAEVSLVPHQKALAERFVERATGQVHVPAADAHPGVALYELLIPHRLKGVSLHDERRLVLVLDPRSAAHPWELLVDRHALDADGSSTPLAVRVPLVRQLLEVEFRDRPADAGDRLALVVGDPPSRFAELPGARAEARAVADQLDRAGFQVTRHIAGDGVVTPETVIGALFAEDWTALHLAAHGVIDEDLGSISGAAEPSGERVTGMILGEDLFLTPALIEQMRTVPELVFLNCCFLGKVDDELEARARAGRHRLAANLATQLIRMGVRAVVAAGWAVDDHAAQRFADIFYDRILHGETFGEAVHAARTSVHTEYPHTTTWGAYQAYGDPAWRWSDRGPQDDRQADQSPTFVGAEECQIALDNLATEVRGLDDRAEQRRRLEETLTEILKAAADHGFDRAPEVLASAGAVWSELGEFDRAIGLNEKALAADARKVPIRIVEQLANLRVRQASAKADIGKIDEALAEIDEAVDSLRALLTVAGRTAERLALLGSAMKRKSMLVPPADRRAALQEMRRWYDEAATEEEENAKPADPYARTNACLAEVMLNRCYGEKPDDGLDARLATATEDAAERYRRSPGFWAAAAKPDLQLVARLHDGSLTGEVEAQADAYVDAARLLASPREFRSVLEHLDFIATMLAEGTTPEPERAPLEQAVRGLRARLATRLGVA